MAKQLRFSAHSHKLSPSDIYKAYSFGGSSNAGYDKLAAGDDDAICSLQVGDVIYERVGTLKKRPKLVTTPGAFEIGKTYHSFTGKPWLCYTRTPKGFLFKVETSGALAEVDAKGKTVHNQFQFLPAPLPTVRAEGEEWYIDRTDV